MPRPVRAAEVAELRAFCAAADLGSLGRAARLLSVSQPALSKRLRTLEALAGARLLERSPRGVTLTPAGTRLYVEARKLLAQAEAVEDVMSGLGREQQPVRLAASHTIAEYVLPQPLVEFERKRERHLSVELVIANSLVVRELVREGRAEFGIAANDPVAAPDGLSEVPLIDDEVVVAVPHDHPWADLQAIPLDELVSTSMVMRDPTANTRRTIEAELGRRGLGLAPPLAEVGSTSAAKATAVSEGAPLLLSSLAMAGGDPDLVARSVAGIDFKRHFVLLLGGELRSAARALQEHLVQTFG